MVCTLPIDVNMIGTHEQNIEYKYVVYSSKVSFLNEAYEYLYHGENGLYNRCLVIDQDRVRKGVNVS